VPHVWLPLQLLRVLALVGVLIGGIGVAIAAPLLSPVGRGRAIRGWFRAVVASSGVRLVLKGTDENTPAGANAGGGALSGQGPALVAATHSSWLDIPALSSLQSMRVLAKSEVRGWPVLGLLAARGGTLFIDRTRLRRLPATVAEIAGVLRGGETMLVFPEGSTWCGRTGGRFYPATMQSAIDAGVPVRPVAVRYQLADGTPTTVAAWVGDDTLLASVWRIAGTRGLTIEIEACPLVSTADVTRRETATAVAIYAKGHPAPVPASHPEVPAPVA
jgi:1-acyl-sn-glycerol-3-phosphate acyltransferase